MSDTLSSVAAIQLDRFCRQYLQLQHDLDLDYPHDEQLRNDKFQQLLYARIFEECALEYPPPQRYQLRVLKKLTRLIEESIQDWDEEGVSDDLMNCFSSLLALSIPSEASAAQQRSYVTYTLSSLPLIEDETPSITLSESRSLLAAAGTTGLRTWEAALFLGDYLCSNKGIVRGKSIIELGAGTGYISILCAKQLGASHVLATDGSDDVVNGLSTNFSLNDLHDTSVVEGKELRWGDALVGSGHPAWIDEQKVDLVLGADVTYDGSGILALLSTFGDLLELFSDLKILISATIRNQATTNKFLNTCEVAGYRLEKIAFRMKTSHEQTGPFYTDKVPIELYQITKS